MTSSSSPTGTHASTERAIDIVVIDRAVDSYTALAAALPAGVEALFVDGGRDGLAQVASALAGRSGIASVGIVSHGAAGMLALGGTYLDAGNVGAYAAQLATLRDALAPGADLLLYGCDIAGSDAGRALVDALAAATGADVAASTDRSGKAALGGDWVLEYRTGDIAAASLVPESALAALGTALAAPTLSSIATLGGGTEDARRTISFADLAAAANEADGDGSVTAFVVQAVSGGSLSIGTDVASATAWAAGANDTIDATHQAFWTPAPDANGNGMNAFTVVARDDGGALSAPAVQVKVNVAAVNDRPTLAHGTSLTAIQEGATASAGDRVDDLVLASGYADPDANDTGPRAIAIVADRADPATEGHWEYSSDAGQNWHDFGNVSATSALFLGADARVRFVPVADYSGTPGALTVYAADGSLAGLASAWNGVTERRVTVDTTTVGATSPQSTNSVDWTIAVSAAATNPSVTVASDTTSLRAGQTAQLTLTFDRAPIGLDRADFLVSGGSVGALRQVDGKPLEYTATFTPTAGTQDLQASVSIAAGGYMDAGGKFNDASNVVLIRGDTLAPTLDIAVVGTPAADAATLQFRVKLSEAVSGVDADDFVLTSTGASSGRIAGVSGSGDTYLVTVADIAGNGSLRLDLAASGTGIVDAVGNTAAGYTGGAVHTVAFNAAPVIVSNGGLDQATVQLAAGRTAVTTVQATDADLDVLDYRIEGGADAGLFVIDPATGALAFKSVPNASRDYQVKVGVSDGKGGVDSQVLTVKVLPEVDTSVPPRQTSVDGATVRTDTRFNADGSTSQVVEVAVVQPGRKDSVGGKDVADIPLVQAGGKAVLAAQLPTGYGLLAVGQAGPKTAGTSLADLVREIETHTAAGSSDRTRLVDGGAAFLGGLDADAPLLVQSVTPGSADGASGKAAIVLSGLPAGAGGVQTALVIDTKGLAGVTQLHLPDVGFAAILGAAQVRGGDGAQAFWGDAASQTIMPGAGDDRVDGGAGVDTVLLAGGSRADYSLRVKDGVLVSTALTGSDGIDTIANVERMQFAAPDTSAAGTIGRLYEAVPGRAADTAGREFWVGQHAAGVSMEAITAAIVGAGEALGQPRDAAAYVAGLYDSLLGRAGDAAGLAFWIGQLDGGAVTRAGLALAFADSAEKLALPSSSQLDFNRSDVATLVRMYEALFGRAPDEGGLNFWIGAHENGLSMRALAQGFLASSESAAHHAHLDDAGFVTALYQTALGHAPDASQAAQWNALLADGQVTRGDVLLGLADSDEMIALVGTVTTSIATM